MPQQVTASAANVLRTTDATEIDDALIAATTNAPMRLSDAIAATYFTHNERTEPRWEALA